MGIKPKIKITAPILKLIAEIDEFKGQWQVTQLLTPEHLGELKKTATIESVGSSTRIEGVKLSDGQIEALLSGLTPFSFRSRDEEEVVGYAEAMNMIFSSYKEIPLDENHIKQLHSVLLKHSSKDVRHRGEYKKFSNNVEAFDQKGKSLGVIFKTTSPFDTPPKMEALLQWANEAFENDELHCLLIIGVFIIHFLAIHSFQDGNGRLSRILTTLLLLKSGYLYVPYSSLERVIEENKDAYYLSLRRAQGTIATNDSRLNDWIIFFLKSLKKQKDVLLQKVKREKFLEALPDLSSEILEIMTQRRKATIADILKITKANRNTLKVRLRELVEKGYLSQHGRGKATWYALEVKA